MEETVQVLFDEGAVWRKGGTAVAALCKAPFGFSTPGSNFCVCEPLECERDKRGELIYISPTDTPTAVNEFEHHEQSLPEDCFGSRKSRRSTKAFRLGSMAAPSEWFHI